MITIGIIGDYDNALVPHQATEIALRHSAHLLGVEFKVQWISTSTILSQPPDFDSFAGIWVAPGPKYKNIEGAIAGIEYARCKNIPVLATCRGFQYLMIEFARNMMKLNGKEIENNDPSFSPIISSFKECTLEDKWIDIILDKTSEAYKLYGQNRVEIQDICGFAISKDFKPEMEKSGMCITATDSEAKPRIVELKNHSYYMGTLFIPQLNSTPSKPHPLITGFLKAAVLHSEEIPDFVFAH